MWQHCGGTPKEEPENTATNEDVSNKKFMMAHLSWVLGVKTYGNLNFYYEGYCPPHSEQTSDLKEVIWEIEEAYSFNIYLFGT